MMKEQWRAGEIIELGHYPQSQSGTKEPVEWKILKVDGERAFVTSVYALDAQPYHAAAGDGQAVRENPKQNDSGIVTLADLSPSGFQDVTWEGSTLRAWLNREFKNTAFSADEQTCLLEVDELKDKISLLELDAHINDADLFPSDASTGCMPTPYAAGKYVDDIEKDRQESATRPLPPRASYWLKSKGIVIHGDEMEGVLGVSCGRINLIDKLAVRPVLMVNLTVYESLLCGNNQNSSFLSRLFKPKKAIVHRTEEEKKYSVTVKKNGSRREFVCTDLGIHISMNDPGDEAAQAIALNLVKAISGDAKTQFAFGELCWGTGGHCQDYHEAVRWYRYAANQGDANAQLNLAEAYFDGKGVEQDEQAAFYYTMKAAENGSPLGMLNAAKCYAFGWGTERNRDEAVKWCDQAAAAGLAEASALRDSL